MNSRIHYLALMLLVSVCPNIVDARTATTAERTACEARIQSKLDAIDSKMRAGYTAKEGEQLRERRRKLEAQRANCRVVQ